MCFRIFTYSLATSHTLNVDHLVYACFNVFIKLENMFYVFFLFQNHCFNKYTQRIRSRLAAPRRVCGVGVRRARQVLFSADAGPKGSLVDRSTLQSQCGINLHDSTRSVTLPNFFCLSIHFHDYFRYSKCTSASSGQILYKSGKRFRTYRNLTVLKMAAIRHLGFSKSRNFYCRSPVCQYASPCQISLKPVKRLQRYGDKTFFPKWRPSAILGLKGGVFGPPTMST